ncbi:MAG: hypothetical protein HYU31_15455 [Deltaproteobacteria bacterium]|nr:hypothetical protein [Deltaproteobacteria bacterium]MBI2182202.1 hypothetical protein [Deltaproteobacteria bacterium]MBI2229531.1 hypothetical protein [Deltaproteobacteria bacterium]MBI2531447.1 hypothetical protein [Deltaproteobacteria bacterium]MBI3065145.1 hypothetical protein [Deltaproteobacteria bacterium]
MGNFRKRWSPTGKPVAHSTTPVGRNPERKPSAKAGARFEELNGQRGMILLSSLLVLSLLITVGVGSRIMLTNDYKISGNLRLSTDAFYLAEAGIEWSKREVSVTSSHPPSLVNRAQSLSSGAFSVAFPSSTAVTLLSAKIVVRSTGRVGTSTHQLQAQLTKTYDLADGAVGLRGNASRVGFSGNSFLISGADHDPVTAAPVAGTRSRPAITVSEDTLRNALVAGLDASQQSNIVGAGGATPAITVSSHISGSAVTQFANDLCSSAQAIPMAVPSDGILAVESQEWGTQSLPQLRCIEGIPGAGDTVRLGGNVSGAGVLVVKNAELIASGLFRWEGLIIVTGSNVGFTILGPETKDIYGSLMVNETGTPGSETAILDIRGSMRLFFSRIALGRITALIPTSTMNNAYGFLPSHVTQDYWRAMTP